MIELTQVKNTDKLGQLQSILNAAFSEIMADQPFVGKVVNPSVNIYDRNNDLKGAVTASNVVNGLNALCFPENNGIFIARLFGMVNFTYPPSADDISTPILYEINIAGVQLATKSSIINTFVTGEHLGLNDSTIGDIIPSVPLRGIPQACSMCTNSNPVGSSCIGQIFEDSNNAVLRVLSNIDNQGIDTPSIRIIF